MAELEFELEEFRVKEMASQEQLTRAVIQVMFVHCNQTWQKDIHVARVFTDDL